MIYHALIKSVLFLSVGTIFLKYSSTKISKIKGALTTLPITGIIFIIGFLAITGTPPFGIFFSKVLIISEGIKTYPIISVLVLFLMTILFIGFLKHIISMFFSKKPEDIEGSENNVWLIFPPTILLIIVVILSFYIPPFLSILINNAVSNY